MKEKSLVKGYGYVYKLMFWHSCGIYRLIVFIIDAKLMNIKDDTSILRHTREKYFTHED